MDLVAKLIAWMLAACFAGLALLHLAEPAALASDPPYPTLTEVAPRITFWLFLSSLLVASTVITQALSRRVVLIGLLVSPLLAAFLVAGVYGVVGTVVVSALYAGSVAPGVYLSMRAA